MDGNAAPGRELPSGEVTFCFVDVAGSTRAFQADPQRYPAALAAHHGLVTGAFADAGGVIVETEGDGLFAAFSDPAAALAGCLAAQFAIAGHDWTPGLELRSRMGLHTDIALPVGNGYVALGVHQAARVAAAAHGGQVLCSAAVASRAVGRLPPGVSLAELGSFRLKDFDQPAVLFELRQPQLSGGFPPPRAPRVVPGNLRLSRTSFVGRDGEIGELVMLLRESRLVTILGPGGVGKTRLGYRLAGELTGRFADGAWVVELAGIAVPGLVTDAVARVLPLPSFAGGSPAEAVFGFLATRSMLLMLDNCEHVLTGAAELADRLLDTAPGVTILATSRVPLGVTGEARFLLGPLSLPGENAAMADLVGSEAVRLFVERAKAVRPRFALEAANAPAVSAICRSLDGLPLALELAAARVAAVSPGDLLARLNDRFAVLASSARGIPERHRTLEATIAWSYELLGGLEQVLLSRLSVFAASFSLDWAEEVCSFPPLAASQILVLMDTLVTESLVVAEQVSGRTEYALLQTVRQYAARRLAKRGEAEDLQRLRADLLARGLAGEDPIFQFTSRTDQYLAAVAAAADDVRASLAWCLDSGEGNRACALIATVYRWWNVTGRIEELVPLARQAVALPGRPSFARVLTYYALLLGLDADLAANRPEAEQMASDMMELASQLGDDNALALALYCLADYPWADGDYAAAARLYGQAGEAARRAGSNSLAAAIARSEAEVRAVGDSERLARSLGRVIAEYRRMGDPFGLAQTLAVVAGSELDSGQPWRAVAAAAEGLQVADEHRYAEVGWRHRTLLARAAAALGQPELAARLLGAVEASLARVGGTVGTGQGGPADRDCARALAIEVLGQERFAELHEAGQRLDDKESAMLAQSLG
jgi:predicted ATPase/class 3 adenylate cyclase